MKFKLNKSGYLSIFFIIFLLFLKTDYRLVTDIYCCGDDHDYFMHASTIAFDFDLDYSNQMEGIENKRYNNNGKIAPRGFIGTGILSAPFLFLGNIIDAIFGNTSKVLVTNYKIIFYSLSPIVYLYASIILMLKSVRILGKNVSFVEIALLILGSGAAYFGFERFSMTHVYEIFTISGVIFLSLKIYTSDKENKILYFLLSIFLLLSLLTRWVNYFVVLIPIILYNISPKKNKLVYKNLLFNVFSIFSILLFLILSKATYGVYTFNPQILYGVNKVDSLISEISFSFLISNIQNFYKLFFSQEFGLLFFNPIVAIGFIISFFKLIRKINLQNVLIIISYLQVFGLILLWGSTASSYGFRYSLCLVPLSIILYKTSGIESLFLKYSTYLLSIFSFFSVLFFESTPGTQLSLTEVTNVFGNNVRYSQPNYLSGYIESLFSLDAYLKIFATSYLGFFIFYIFINMFSIDSLVGFMEKLNLPTTNQNFLDLLDQINNISTGMVLILLLFTIWLGLNSYKYYSVKSKN